MEDVVRGRVPSALTTAVEAGPANRTAGATSAPARVRDLPEHRTVWDTGHQAYVHNVLVGRAC